MPWVGFETMIPAFEGVKRVHASDRGATVIGCSGNYLTETVLVAPSRHTLIILTFSLFTAIHRSCSHQYKPCSYSIVSYCDMYTHFKQRPKYAHATTEKLLEAFSVWSAPCPVLGNGPMNTHSGTWRVFTMRPDTSLYNKRRKITGSSVQ
jgi:hypothetical protein